MIAFSIITSKTFKFFSEGALGGGSLLIIVCIITSIICMISRFTASVVNLCLRLNAVRRWGIIWSIIGFVDCILQSTHGNFLVKHVIGKFTSWRILIVGRSSPV